MTTRLRGTAYKALLSRLPRNLVLFDGHCLMCQARVQYVLERNFSFFSILTYFTHGEDSRATQLLSRHQLFFASLDSQEADFLLRTFFKVGKAAVAVGAAGGGGGVNDGSGKTKTKVATSTISSSSAGAKSRDGDAGALTLPNELVLLFIEKAPSRQFGLLRRYAGSSSGGAATTNGDDDALFANPTTVDTPLSPSTTSSIQNRRQGQQQKKKNKGSSADVPGVHTSELVKPENTDLLISTNFTAMCRIGMHLDRVLQRLVFHAVYVCVPTKLGNAWFARYVCRRRRTMWGTTEEDVVQTHGALVGIKERRWTWRGVNVNQRV